MALLDAEDKQALRELAFGKVEKVKDKIWRAILLIGLLIILALGTITAIRLRHAIDNIWLLIGVFAAGASLLVIILSLRIFSAYHAQLRKFLLPLTIICICYVAFALFAPCYSIKREVQCAEVPCPQGEVAHVSFTGLGFKY